VALDLDLLVVGSFRRFRVDADRFVAVLQPGLRRSLVMSGSSEGDPEGGQGAGRVAGVMA
jgi:hypothetical protein